MRRCLRVRRRLAAPLGASGRLPCSTRAFLLAERGVSAPAPALPSRLISQQQQQQRASISFSSTPPSATLGRRCLRCEDKFNPVARSRPSAAQSSLATVAYRRALTVKLDLERKGEAEVTLPTAEAKLLSPSSSPHRSRSSSRSKRALLTRKIAKAERIHVNAEAILAKRVEARANYEAARSTLTKAEASFLEERARIGATIPEAETFGGSVLEWPSDELLDAFQYGMPENKSRSIARHLKPFAQGRVRLQSALNRIKKRLNSSHGPSFEDYLPVLERYIRGDDVNKVGEDDLKNILSRLRARRQEVWGVREAAELLCRVRWTWPETVCADERAIERVKKVLGGWPQCEEQDRAEAAELVAEMGRCLPTYTNVKFFDFISSRLEGKTARQLGVDSKFICIVASKLGPHAFAVLPKLAEFMCQSIKPPSPKKSLGEWLQAQRINSLSHRYELGESLYMARKRYILESMSLAAPYSVEHLEEHVKRVLGEDGESHPSSAKAEKQHFGEGKATAMATAKESGPCILGPPLDMYLTGHPEKMYSPLPPSLSPGSQKFTLEMDANYADSMLAALPADEFESEEDYDSSSEYALDEEGYEKHAMLLEEELEMEVAAPPDADRTVFLCNVPCDCSERDLVESLAACGEVESVRIIRLGQRVSTKPERKANARIPRISEMVSLQNAPKNLTHAFVTFKDEEAHEKACMEDMRVLGVIIQGEACRVLPASRRTLLHIENTEGLTYSAFSQRIKEALGGYGRVVRGSSTAYLQGAHTPASCRLKTPNHRAALEVESHLIAAGLRPTWIPIPYHLMSGTSGGGEKGQLRHYPPLHKMRLGRGLLDAVDNGHIRESGRQHAVAADAVGGNVGAAEDMTELAVRSSTSREVDSAPFDYLNRDEEQEEQSA